MLVESFPLHPPLGELPDLVRFLLLKCTKLRGERAVVLEPRRASMTNLSSPAACVDGLRLALRAAVVGCGAVVNRCQRPIPPGESVPTKMNGQIRGKDFLLLLGCFRPRIPSGVSTSPFDGGRRPRITSTNPKCGSSTHFCGGRGAAGEWSVVLALIRDQTNARADITPCFHCRTTACLISVRAKWKRC